MYEAREPTTNGRTWRFKGDLGALARSITGRKDATYDLEHETAFDPPNRFVLILTPSGTGAWNVVTRVMVPTEAIRR